jgi:DNA-binding MarR family transcriptional regulator
MAPRNRLQALQASRRYGIGRLLLLARRDFLARLGEKMNDSETIVQARGRLLPYVDVDGTRSVDLARRMGMTKQAVGKLVRELEEDGLLYRELDGADGRAFLVKFTEAGVEYLTRMHKCISQIERDYGRLVGPERMAVVREALSLIVYGEEDAGELDPSGGLDVPATGRTEGDAYNRKLAGR